MSIVAKRLDALVYHLVLHGTNMGLSNGNIVLDGDPAPPKGAQPPIFGPGDFVLDGDLGTSSRAALAERMPVQR